MTIEALLPLVYIQYIRFLTGNFGFNLIKGIINHCLISIGPSLYLPNKHHKKASKSQIASNPLVPELLISLYR